MIEPWKKVWSRLQISNDDFIRTTEERHEGPAKAFLQHLYDSGEIYAGEYEGPYCVACEQFYAESELIDGNCPIHGRPVERLKEENYFFRLSKQADWLLGDYYARTPPAVRPEARLNEVIGHVRGGLQDISVSRPSLEWGIPVPWDPKHVIYVWIEALQNYITALGYPDGELFKTFWPGTHLIGKDILRFHAVIWPAMLHAAGEEPPSTVFAHGWLLVRGEKMSKTKLTGIHPDQLLDVFGVDAYRYYFLREIAFGQDGNFSWESMVARYNADLANGLGNLASRVLSMIVSYYDGVVPEPGPAAGQEGLERAVADALPSYLEAMDAFAFHEAIDAAFGIVREANGFIVAAAPWKMAKDPAQRPQLGTVLWSAAEALRVLALLLVAGDAGSVRAALGTAGDRGPAVRSPARAGGRLGRSGSWDPGIEGRGPVPAHRRRRIDARRHPLPSRHARRRGRPRSHARGGRRARRHDRRGSRLERVGGARRRRTPRALGDRRPASARRQGSHRRVDGPARGAGVSPARRRRR